MRELLSGLATSFEAKRRLAALRPFSSREEAETVLGWVAALKARAEQGEGLPAFDVEDLSAAFARLYAEGGVLDPDDFLRMAPLLRAIRRARETLEAARDEFPDLAVLAAPLVPLPHLERAVENTFESTGEVKDSASPELRRIRRERETRRERLRAKMERLAAALADHDQGSLVTLREGRYVLSVPQGMRSRVPGVVQDRSASGATFFVEPLSAVDDNNALREMDAEERAEIRRILAELTAAFRDEREALEAGHDRVAELDGLRARVLLALRWGGERAELTDARAFVGPNRGLYINVYCTSTSWHKGAPTGEYVASVMRIARELTDGMRLYCLPWSQANERYQAAVTLTREWATAP